GLPAREHGIRDISKSRETRDRWNATPDGGSVLERTRANPAHRILEFVGGPMRMRRSSCRSLAGVLLLAAIFSTANCGGKSSPAVPAASAASGALSAAGPLLKSVGSAVPGLSQAQSILGVGSLLGLAKTKMPASQFSSVAGAIPGADALIG